MREIVLDTETTGLDPSQGDRLVEIGAVEIIDKIATGRVFHQLINPERDVPEGAFRVHGHSTQSLKDKPVFAAIAQDFLAFIGDSPLVIHNAEFDVKFLNTELISAGYERLKPDRIVDSLAIARSRHPGLPNNLNALCDRYGIDRSHRVQHGALLDAEILVEVYCELSGGRQRSLSLSIQEQTQAKTADQSLSSPRPYVLPARVDAEQIAAHEAFIKTLGTDVVWRQYKPPKDDHESR